MARTSKTPTKAEKTRRREAKKGEAQKRLASQRRLISKLEENGQDATEARTDLEALKIFQKRRVARSAR